MHVEFPMVEIPKARPRTLSTGSMQYCEHPMTQRDTEVTANRMVHCMHGCGGVYMQWAQTHTCESVMMVSRCVPLGEENRDRY